MYKNLPAILRNDAKTVLVRPILSCRSQTQLAIEHLSFGAQSLVYVTNLDLTVGEFVIAFYSGMPTVLVVAAVDPSVSFSPDSEFEYPWIIAKVNLTSHLKNVGKNKEINEAFTTAYTPASIPIFAQTLLSGLTQEARDSISTIIGKS